MASVVSRGYKIHYESSGDGPPLMLVPGFTQWAEQWDSAQYVAALNDRFRVVRIDPLGHGLSDKPHEPQAYRWSSVIDDLVAVADAEGLERPMWWGFSRGAELVLDLAHLHPTRAAAVVVGSATNSFGTDVESTGRRSLTSFGPEIACRGCGRRSASSIQLVSSSARR